MRMPSLRVFRYCGDPLNMYEEDSAGKFSYTQRSPFLIVIGFLSWDKDSCHVDLEKELLALVTQAPEGEEARNGNYFLDTGIEIAIKNTVFISLFFGYYAIDFRKYQYYKNFGTIPVLHRERIL